MEIIVDNFAGGGGASTGLEQAFGRLPKTHQISKIGNSVCPVMSRVLAESNLPELCEGERMVA